MNETDHPNVIAPPPIIALLHLVAGGILEAVVSTSVLSVVFARGFGWILVFVGLVVVLICVWEFRRKGTNIPTRKPATRVVQSGFYRFTRNPIYLSFAVILVGAGIGFDSLWIALSVVPFIFVMNWGVIAREERYLEHKFGEEYLNYKSQVRRWV